MSKKARKRPPTARASTALANRSNRPQITPISRISWTAATYTCSAGRRVCGSSRSIKAKTPKMPGLTCTAAPCDAASYAPAPAPKTASIAAEQRVSSVAALPATSIQKLIAATENLRKFAASAYAASATTTRVMRDPATGSVIVERRR